MNQMKIIIAGGGTGGHIFPAIAVANALKKINPAIEILFVGANGKMEMEKVPLSGYNIKGIDIAGQPGQPIVSVGDGTVLYANTMRGFGNLVIIDHRDGLVSAYGHNKTMLVKEGQTVAKGQRIAEMGDIDAESVRLHFEIRQLGKAVDPIGFLPSR
jgi:murein DD-endopeptidase MepM/ murein hydrolase activator NlpD